MPIKTMTVQVPVATNAAERAQLQAEELAKEQEQQRAALAERNRKRLTNIAAPKPGTSLFVAKSAAVRSETRGRAGVQFDSTPREVKVVSDEDFAKMRANGVADIVTVDGAEQILEDANAPHLGLIVWAHKGEASSADLVAKSDDELDALATGIAAEKARRARPRDAEKRITSTRKAEDATGEEANAGHATDTARPVTEKPAKK